VSIFCSLELFYGGGFGEGRRGSRNGGGGVFWRNSFIG
jgi:hypothetical protein